MPRRRGAVVVDRVELPENLDKTVVAGRQTDAGNASLAQSVRFTDQRLHADGLDLNAVERKKWLTPLLLLNSSRPHRRSSGTRIRPCSDDGSEP